jgi:hypothetical protein
VNINISSEDILYLVWDTFALCCSPTKQDNVMTVSNGQLAAGRQKGTLEGFRVSKHHLPKVYCMTAKG